MKTKLSGPAFLHLVFTLGLFVAIFIPTLSLADESARSNVFSSILPTAYLIDRIGGTRVDVSVMVGPGQSPATYEPTPKQMAKLSETSLYFRIGVPFENSWMDKITSINSKLTIVDLRKGIVLREIEGHSHHAEDGHDGEQSHDGKDPHLWLSPKNAKIMANTILQALSEIAPQYKDEFASNLDNLLIDLDRVDREIEEILSPVKNRRFMVFHPAWGYFADDYDLEQVPIEIEGKSPSAKQLASFIEKAKEEKIKVIFVQKQFSPTSAETVAQSIHGKVVAMDPLDRDYLNNLMKIANTLAEGLE